MTEDDVVIDDFESGDQRTVTVPIEVRNLDQVDDITSYSFDLDIGATPLTFVEFDTTNTLTGAADFNFNSSSSSGVLTAGGASFQNPAIPLQEGGNRGVLVKAVFEVNQSGTGTAQFPPNAFTFNGGTVTDNLDRADFEVAVSNNLVKVSNTTATVGSPSTVEVTASDLSDLDPGIISFDIGIQLENPAAPTTPVSDAVTITQDAFNSNKSVGFDSQTNVLSISSFTGSGELTGTGTLLEIDLQAINSETVADITFTDDTAFILDTASGDTADVAVQGGQLQVLENTPPNARDDEFATGENSLLEITNEASGVLANDSDPDGDALSVSAVEGASGDVGSQITLASGASLTLNGNGTFTYDPPSEADTLGSNETFEDSFEYTAADDFGGADQAFAKITLQGENDTPTISGLPEADTIDEDGSAGPIGFQVSDAESDSTALTLSGSSGNTDLVPDDSIEIGADGVTVTPRPDSNGTAEITVEVSDGDASASGTFTLEVEPVNDAPVISGLPETETIDEDESAGPIGFQVSDVESDSSAITLSGSSDDTGLVPNDSIEIGASGVTVTPSADSFGSANITITATDPGGESTEDSLTVEVESVPDAPVAVNDTFGVEEDSTLEVRASNGLLANDRHPDGEGFTVSEALVSTPDSGDVDVSANGSFEYIPNADFAGTDQFVYQVSDGDSTDTATVTIDVEQINDQPTITAIADTTIDEDTSTGPIGFTVGDVETAPSDLALEDSTDNPDLIESIELGGSGADRTVTVTPAVDSFGTATIELTVTDQPVDGKAAKDSTQSFTLTVNPVNDSAVVATNEGLTLEEGGTATIPTDSLSASDVEDGPADLTFDVTDGPSNGTLLVGGSEDSTFTQADLEAGDVAYSHDGSETTADTLTFDLSDSEGAGPTGQTFAIDVQPVNDAPEVATNEGLTLDEGATETIPTDSLSASDPDDAAAGLRFDVTDGPSNGTLLVGGSEDSSFTQANLEAGDVAYSHDGSETTSDSFTFALSDPDGAGPTGQTFDITVDPVNDGPTISGLTDADTTISEDTSTDPIGFTISDPETAPSNLTVTDSTDNPGLIESVEFGGSGASRTVTVTPAADSNGTADITVTVVNGGQKTASQTFTLTVEQINDPPVISGLPETETIDEDESAGPIGFQVSDVESDSSAITLSGSSDDTGLVPNDSIEIGADGVTVTPRPDSNGTANITITATDPGGESTEDSLTVEVESVPDAPVAVDDSYPNDDVDEVLEDSTLSVSAPNGLKANDRHPDGEQFSVSSALASTPGNGTVNVSGNGSFTYTPNEDFAGTDQFVYQVSDGDSTDTATVTIDVEQINDQPTITAIADTIIDEDTSTGPIGFTVGDVETAPSDLALEDSTDNPDLIESIELGGSGADRTVTVTPVADSNGTATISLTVTDQEVDGKAAKDSTQSFELTVESVNDPAVVEVNEGLTLEEGGTATIPTDSLSASDVEDGPADLTFDVTDGPSNGTLLVGGSEDSTFTQADLEAGDVAYSHDGSETTADTLTFDLSDSEGAGPTGQTFAIDVQPVNDAPEVATNEGLTLDEGATETIPTDSLSASDPDDAAAGLRFDVTDGPSNGTLLVGGSEDSSFTQANLEAGDVAYSHDGSETTSDSFTFALSDPDGAGPTGQTFDITVDPVNDGPTISGLTDADTTISEDTSTDPIGFTISDPETAPSNLTVTDSTDNPGLIESVEFGGSGASRTVTVTPAADSNGTADITVTVVNGGQKTASQTFTLTVEQINDPPVISGLPETETIDEDTSTDPIEFTVGDVETAPSDLDVTTASSDTDLVPTDSIELSGSGADRTVTVTPVADSNGTATISLTVTDQEVDGKAAKDSTQSFTLTVNPVNDSAVVATNEGLTLEEGGTATIPTDSLSASDVEDGPADLTFDVTDGPSNGTLLVGGSEDSTFTQADLEAGDVAYSHDGSETTSDSFTFDLSDSEGAGPTGQTFAIDVQPVNEAPVISGLPETETIDEDTSTGPIEFAVSDPENDPLELTAESGNTNLVPDDSIELGFSSDGRALVATPSADSNGTADITVTAEDDNGSSTEETLTLEVEPVPDAPVAVNDTFSVDENDELVRSAPNGLLANDFHPDGEDFQASPFALSGPENGEVNIGSDGSFRYTPAEGFSGTDQFVYQISDGDSTGTGTVTIDVEAIEVTISGSVSYPGEGDTGLTDGRPLSGVPVQVSAVSGSESAMDTTDTDGTFSVSVGTGEYVVQAQPDRDVPDEIKINATDANRTIGAYLGSNPFAGDLQAEVADVNESGSANATDALKMALFFIGDVSAFEAGDWATTADTADVSGGSDASVSVLAAAYGDADLSGAEQGGSSAVATASSASSSAATAEKADLRGVETGKTFEVPVRLDGAATVGSYSLEIDFPADEVSFEGVAETDRNVMSTAEEGTVRLSWFDQSGEQPMKLGAGASLVTLRFSAAEGVEKGTVVTPTVETGELAGPGAQPLTSAELSVEGVEIGSLPDEFALKGNYPNPVASGPAQIEMDLPSRTSVTVEVYNVLGQRVQTIERSMAAGTGQTVRVDGSQLASGQYFYRVKADLQNGTAEGTGRITVVR